MSVGSAPMYWATCDYPGCTVASRDNDDDHSNGAVFDTPEAVEKQFERWEGGFADDYGWIKHDGKHYCYEHVEWDEETDKRVPKPIRTSSTEGKL